jgi:hypothetical protein
MCTASCIRLSSMGVAAEDVFIAGLHVEDPPANATDMLKRYDVTWNSPGRDASGSTSLGNGEIGPDG